MYSGTLFAFVLNVTKLQGGTWECFIYHNQRNEAQSSSGSCPSRHSSGQSCFPEPARPHPLPGPPPRPLADSTSEHHRYEAVWVLAASSRMEGSQGFKAIPCPWKAVNVGALQCSFQDFSSGHGFDSRARMPGFESQLCDLSQVARPLCAAGACLSVGGNGPSSQDRCDLGPAYGAESLGRDWRQVTPPVSVWL